MTSLNFLDFFKYLLKLDVFINYVFPIYYVVSLIFFLNNNLFDTFYYDLSSYDCMKKKF